MRLASVQDSSRDGSLVVVNRAGTHAASARSIVPNLQQALDDWEATAPLLEDLAGALEQRHVEAIPLDPQQLVAPLPRAYEWLDGSAYLHHVRLVRKARGAEPPSSLTYDPLVYQGGSGVLLGPTSDLPLIDPEWGLDFEAEVAVILGDTPRGTKAADASRYIRLLLLVNDVTYRSLVPTELQKGFGFLQSKPASAFSPFAVTPDELDEHFAEGRLQLPLQTRHNGNVVGNINAGRHMHFSFCQLIEHITKTRRLTAGTLLGSGTVSAAPDARGPEEYGVSCLAERRMLEKLEAGKPTTAFLKAGDTVAIDVHSSDGRNVFGTIDQKVVAE